MTYNRIAGASTDAKMRLQWLEKGSHWKGKFYPQPYTQLAKVLRDMGHDSDARLILEDREARLRQDFRDHRYPDDPDNRPNYVNALARSGRLLFHYVFQDKAMRYLIGYGHQPFRSIWALIILIFVATIPAYHAWEEGSFAPNSAVLQNSADWQRIESSETKPAHVWSGDTPPQNWVPATPGMLWQHEAPGRDWETFNSVAYGIDVVIPIIDFGQTEAWAPSTTRGFWGWLLWWSQWVLSFFGWVATALGAAAVTGVIRRD